MAVPIAKQGVPDLDYEKLVGPLQNSRVPPTSKIGQKHTKNTITRIFGIFLMYFSPVLRVVVRSFSEGGASLSHDLGSSVLICPFCFVWDFPDFFQ